MAFHCKKALLIALLLALSGQVHALDVGHASKIGKLFNQAGVSGTFVLYDLNADLLLIHNPSRAEKRFIPASTFKIPNSLIGLSTGAVGNEYEIIPYGGKPQPIKSWEQDMGLSDAIKISNVPVYQELARRIGLEVMRSSLVTVGYGNMETGSEVDAFWLKGPLKISAVEQVKFLTRLVTDDLPFPIDVQQTVRDMVKLDQKADRVLYGKTGWTTAPDPDIGWWVGWVTSDNGVYIFALNIDIETKADVAQRVKLGEACLLALGIF